MKDISFVDYLLVGLTVTTFVLAAEERVDCPKLCVCEVRPWFSPSSVYMEAPTVDCNDLGLFNLPIRLPADTQVVLLQTNNIAKIENPLDYLPNITEIDLSQNNLSSISDVNLGHLPQLLSLHMEENWICALPDNSLSQLINLQELYLNHNLISFISPEAFRGLQSLLRLHLNSNRLQSISSKWFEPLLNLEILMIGENPVLSIQDMNFKPLRNLRSLVLTRMNLSQIPDDALLGLDNLESISFYDNAFPKVPHGALRHLKSLKFLDLNKNPIGRIQRGDFVDMLHLKELGINSMPELVSIDSFALNNLPELTKIEATNNPKLSYIHPNAFYRLPRMETLMLNGNALSALHRITVESLPNLREVSMHSNPIRCDCVVRWMNMNKTNIRFMEPDSLFCVEPPEYEGQHVRQVHFREMMEICLPLISSESFPTQISVDSGRSVSLHCRAFAEPEPDIYWVTPTGRRILPNAVSDKFYMHPEGTLDIYDITENEAGLYTCVAHNLVGADLKSVSVEVNGYFPLPVNDSLNVNIQSVQTKSVLISWKATHGSLSPNIRWNTMPSANHPTVAFTARVPSDVTVYNLTHLSPATQYRVCVDIHSIHHKHDTKCVNVITKGLEQAVKDSERWDVALIAAFGVLFFVMSVAGFLIYVFMRNHCFYEDLRQYPSKMALMPETRQRSPFTRLWISGKGMPDAVEVKATFINVLDNDF
ncbi:leucine-rich repeat neuronal protein 3-like [Myxocyprinus asiaticus]|uniref:leucine-rich repeat neuronal protein 3-like n=1 Tax=Myxocyprinus asiaticus TaxID=70543 RepID=UPI002222C43B|nr:leucine-rich repeat neuronal protein 3-like [Myxocyprinus asiaticus]XP_051544171.1 leucine-rich repeat neuronal protein 3-like [Myxocyprinus asiaticus]